MTMPVREDVNVSTVMDADHQRPSEVTKGLLGTARPYNSRLHPVLPFYIALYVVGMLVGLGAKNVFDVQLRRPGSRELIGLVLLVLLLWGAISITHTPFTDVLLPMVWAGTGLLAGFGSRELHTAS